MTVRPCVPGVVLVEGRADAGRERAKELKTRGRLPSQRRLEARLDLFVDQGILCKWRCTWMSERIDVTCPKDHWAGTVRKESTIIYGEYSIGCLQTTKPQNTTGFLVST